jgi:hypothetical protein
MSVTINARGTSVPSFAIGKSGTVITQAGTITPPAGNDLTIALGVDNTLSIATDGPGPSLITTSDNQDLHINPAIGGGQFLVLNANRWPIADGTFGQVLATNGSGVLGFITPTSGSGLIPINNI